ncbi:N-acetylmuramoyl-L-alanine amidase [Microbulbifer thermotolerans]|uniref:N-acetylmuramoyl-L-alanine amidase n=1 Tax=Microbulbifer thermotolerans TaxID=252514 RepID=UPI0008F253E9|nr:N-acetylmuramoyl-L-alanine amidase [Microbulbifer thermotolerans]MCX2780314.1 N-acetylmuramoyl-L-alanine amidase [Microbulbifer thermotolerans]MCX2782777.1 N-acetylmuramoyl-L-alanine amidase [Microbulbifer thermotolerans]MCX2805331.1 N-acetylmuramoyl-L-alanine amidase [Microbulbifer thermotolerans]MCX2835702.1 N-acetylmuramoyl-L-alanine amidase [Microbulbifer thermotolerans]WKT60836.1 N-acetylmuramoyl-L-alanine amidase [Microbulbifer thermotolerans]
MKTVWQRLLVLVILGKLILPAQAAEVEGVRLWRAPDHTRLVFDLSGPAEHKLFTLTGPHRVVVDVTDTRLAAQLDHLELGNTPIERLRHGRHDKKNLRVVLDLKQQVKPKSFALKRHGGLPDRLVIDLYDRVENEEKTLQQVSRERDILVAIDAGHGGEDPGALGPGGLREKDVVLAIAKKLHSVINAKPGFSARLVRSGDYYIPLRERVKKGRGMRADLFVSIHADAFTRKDARGAGVYAVSSRGATSETARFLAQRENESDLIGGAGSLSLDDKDDTLAGVLLDLSMTATMNASLDVGASVLNSLGSVTHLHKKKVEQANFAVLRSPDVPSILVETGFITNPQEARRLRDPSFQRKLAEKLSEGIVAHFTSRPPAGTWLAANRDRVDRRHTIARGDTLSSIAARYNVSVSELKKVNGIDSSVIRVGQTLTIPSG